MPDCRFPRVLHRSGRLRARIPRWAHRERWRRILGHRRASSAGRLDGRRRRRRPGCQRPAPRRSRRRRCGPRRCRRVHLRRPRPHRPLHDGAVVDPGHRAGRRLRQRQRRAARRLRLPADRRRRPPPACARLPGLGRRLRGPRDAAARHGAGAHEHLRLLVLPELPVRGRRPRLRAGLPPVRFLAHRLRPLLQHRHLQLLGDSRTRRSSASGSTWRPSSRTARSRRPRSSSTDCR